MITRKYRQYTEAEIKALKNSASWCKFRLSDFLGITLLSAVFFAGGGWVLGKGLDSLIFVLFQAQLRKGQALSY